MLHECQWIYEAHQLNYYTTGVITKPSSVQRSVIVRLLVACGMAAGCGGAHAQRSPRGAVYRRRGLLPKAQHALLTQTVHKKRAISTRSPQKKCRSIYTYCMVLRNFFGGKHLRVRWW
jgi:hypothetical protein